MLRGVLCAIPKDSKGRRLSAFSNQSWTTIVTSKWISSNKEMRRRDVVWDTWMRLVGRLIDDRKRRNGGSYAGNGGRSMPHIPRLGISKVFSLSQ